MIPKHMLITVIAMTLVVLLSSASKADGACSGCRAPSAEDVILLHGLCRTPRSMAKMQRALTQAGYTVWNVDYPSRTAPIEKLADNAIGQAIIRCRQSGATRSLEITGRRELS